MPHICGLCTNISGFLKSLTGSLLDYNCTISNPIDMVRQVLSDRYRGNEGTWLVTKIFSAGWLVTKTWLIGGHPTFAWEACSFQWVGKQRQRHSCLAAELSLTSDQSTVCVNTYMPTFRLASRGRGRGRVKVHLDDSVNTCMYLHICLHV